MTAQQRDVLDSLVQIGRAGIKDIAEHTGVEKEACAYALGALVRDGYAMTEKAGHRRFWNASAYGKQAVSAFRGESTSEDAIKLREIVLMLDEAGVPAFSGNILLRIAFLLGKSS